VYMGSPLRFSCAKTHVLVNENHKGGRVYSGDDSSVPVVSTPRSALLVQRGCTAAETAAETVADRTADTTSERSA